MSTVRALGDGKSLPSLDANSGAGLDTRDGTDTMLKMDESKAQVDMPNQISKDVSPEGSPSLSVRPDVLWCLEVEQDGKQLRTFYKDEPWKGINNGLPDSDPDDDMDSRAVLTYFVSADVIDITGKESNTSTTWRDRPVDFQFGRDAVLFTRFPANITIHSKRLISIVNAALSYYPYRSDPDRFHANPYDSFPDLMHCYQELKHYFSAFLESLPEEQRVDPKLNCPSCGDEKFNKLIMQHLNLRELQTLGDLHDLPTAKDLAVLLRLLSGMYRATIAPTMHAIYFEERPKIAFNSLWILFKPGTTVYVKQSAFWNRPDPREDPHLRHHQRRPVEDTDDEYSACVVASCLYAPTSSNSNDSIIEKPQRLELLLRSIGWTGTAFRPLSHDAMITKFDGSRPILDLPVVPAYVHDESDTHELRQRLERRGRKYVTMLDKLAPHRLYKHEYSKYEGEIIVDPEAYRQQVAEDWRPPPPLPRGTPVHLPPRQPNIHDGESFSPFKGLIDVSPSDLGDTSESKQIYLLLPRRLEGFALRTKRWMVFEVEGIQDDTPFRSYDKLDSELVLGQGTNKEYLQTLLPRGARHSSSAHDFVEGKGEGRIFLLYGGPGTGKTLTVECVANDTRRPLLRITAQDVGLSDRAENNLQTWFTLAARWDAILLIDEADLFLEKRKDGDLTRNSLSTVFLRSMEYYSGVLFLTTNRGGHIDDSFVSRITCPIGYPPLTTETKGKIVRKFVKRFQETNKILISEDAADYLIENCTELNGRELRNVLMNAVEAAESKLREGQASKLGQDGTRTTGIVQVGVYHVKTAVDTQVGFQKYLKELKGKDEQTRARMNQNW
ncbi:hypothetical protein HBH56_208050 [Parastagonospora nodorum]|uniref:AAA+ ATPase domain-containing protein n=2 Tax=Phaeosphaeria nodorum (strain SN15 / ATCC MYA-4574 / FGSC 10173) TaxID=321614 RepID=A0A7U2F751_PHANO|nr:hypothetical protein SNOG_15075 [Parastagonospora nodorum SN15]KAH3906066.1 hypothetical protein HBH56_208050 [Parastagonospora nodorum]EAT77618.1 hypothetical protein SNOG_15075 [Parastagonospora nodorum SN15]KAH3923529.1 hypothetical protein HBH54_206920 [Parastagonospora nodorum]KAH4129282.1 hypothetical protein HBH45_208670 [Parastagonospora nodorum]KAH4149406.1 hypothetical protein HBH44_194260 [Parastagonospora nodorum]